MSFMNCKHEENCGHEACFAECPEFEQGENKDKHIAALETERDDLLKALNETGKLLDDTQSKLKAAEDHAATMEACAKDAEEKLAKVFKVIKLDSCPSPPSFYCHRTIKHLGCIEHLACTPETCPLIPKEGK
jgi:hypothetical protein